MEISEALQKKLDRLPTSPGVYVHRSEDEKALYVGKAKNLRNRVRSYFQKSRAHDGRLRLMIKRIADVEIIVTDTEVEALILENNLIKKLKPRYNINLRDDKTFPFICVKNEPFPRVFPTRTVRKDGSRYFGPYSDVKSMRLMLRAIRSIFKLRTCSLNLTEQNIEAGKFQVCLEYHIKNCAGPCVGEESRAHYDETIRQVQQMLSGRTKALINLLKEEMVVASSNMEFELAAELRDRAAALQKYTSRQKIVSADEFDRDLFAIETDPEDGLAIGVVFKIREGKLLGKQQRVLQGTRGEPAGKLMQTFLEWYYTESVDVPDDILLATPAEDTRILARHLEEKKGKRVPIAIPERGEKASLMRMVSSNAKLQLNELKLQKMKGEEARIPISVTTLKTDLMLPSLPRRIECFDISHLSGTGTVASCVVFVDGRPRKSEYRLFNIRSVEGKPDDFASMQEVISRRYRRIENEGGPWPDLIVVDGGKGQLSSSVAVLKDEGLYGKAPIVALAKRLEEVFFPGDTDATMIDKSSTSIRLLQQLRDEAHRFAITAQRKKRKKSLKTGLTNIPGIGEKTAQKLIKAFGSLKEVETKGLDELVPVVGKRMAERVVDHFAKG